MLGPIVTDTLWKSIAAIISYVLLFCANNLEKSRLLYLIAFQIGGL